MYCPQVSLTIIYRADMTHQCKALDQCTGLPTLLQEGKSSIFSLQFIFSFLFQRYMMIDMISNINGRFLRYSTI
jgi:hypothetical protein